MEWKSISEVSRDFGVSTRTLRYYEQIGLLDSNRLDDYAYRVYDTAQIIRLQHILTLRKLRVPLKQIEEILNTSETRMAVEAFNRQIGEIDVERDALGTIRSILAALTGRLRQMPSLPAISKLFDESELQNLLTIVTPATGAIKEVKNMSDLNNAIDNLSKLNDVRILYLPPATVAASHHVGEEPEQHAGEVMDRFVRERDLCRIKPDLRQYGFNHPNPAEGQEHYGYERWVTVPPDMDVPEPLVKKTFAGGLYAAHMIRFGNFHEWEWFMKWAQDSPAYEPVLLDDGGDCMHGLLEEHLDYYHFVQQENPNIGTLQLDLLIPIRVKANGG